MAGETVPYVICIRLDSSSNGSGYTADAAGGAAEAAGGTPQQQQPQAEAAASPQQQQQQDAPAAAVAAGDAAAASPAAAAAAAAAGGSSGGVGVRAMTPAAAASRGGSAGGSIAERAFHPDELRSDPSLVIDAEYYLAQQVGGLLRLLPCGESPCWGGRGGVCRRGACLCGWVALLTQGTAWLNRWVVGGYVQQANMFVPSLRRATVCRRGACLWVAGSACFFVGEGDL